MTYIPDPDLEFLEFVSSQDMHDLVFCLTHSGNGETRLTEQLTGTDIYKAYFPDHHRYWREVAEELQKFGGDTAMNVLRMGKGVPYRELAGDVHKAIQARPPDNSGIDSIETAILEKMLSDAVKHMDMADLQKIADLSGSTGFEQRDPKALAQIFEHIFRKRAVKTPTRDILGNILAVSLACCNPSMGIVAYLTAPAYRVTIPAVAQIACLRKLYTDQNYDTGEKKARFMYRPAR